MVVCPHCGKETRSSDRFCQHCGRLMDMVVGASAGPLPLRASVRETGSGQMNPSNGAGGLPEQSKERGASSGEIAGNGAGASAASKRTAIARLVMQTRAGSNQAGGEIALNGQDVTIGRAPGCDIVLADDPLTSRRHSLLRFDGRAYTVADLGSSNGTYVNDVEIHEDVPLTSGDKVTVGEHEFLYLTGAGASAAIGQERFNTDGFAIRTPPSFSAAAPLLASQPEQAALPGAANEDSSSPPSQDSSAAPATPAGMRTTERPAGGTVKTGEASEGSASTDAMARDIEDLRARLLSMSTALAQRSAGAETGARQMRETITELRAQVEDALAKQRADGGDAASGSAAPLDELLGVARAAAENPRHLDHLTALSGRASDIAKTLEAQAQRVRSLESARQSLTNTLEVVRARLAALLEEDGLVVETSAPSQ